MFYVYDLRKNMFYVYDLENQGRLFLSTKLFFESAHLKKKKWYFVTEIVLTYREKKLF